MTIRPLIVACVVLFGAVSCMPRARLRPGTDMAYPDGALTTLVDGVVGTCLRTQPNRAGRTDVEMRQCAAVRADSTRAPFTGQPTPPRP